jgi:hypothetical protein
MFVNPHVLSPKLLDGFRLNLVLRVYSKINWASLILVHVDPI